MEGGGRLRKSQEKNYKIHKTNAHTNTLQTDSGARAHVRTHTCTNLCAEKEGASALRRASGKSSKPEVDVDDVIAAADVIDDVIPEVKPEVIDGGSEEPSSKANENKSLRRWWWSSRRTGLGERKQQQQHH